MCVQCAHFKVITHRVRVRAPSARCAPLAGRKLSHYTRTVLVVQSFHESVLGAESVRAAVRAGLELNQQMCARAENLLAVARLAQHVDDAAGVGRAAIVNGQSIGDADTATANRIIGGKIGCVCGRDVGGLGGWRRRWNACFCVCVPRETRSDY